MIDGSRSERSPDRRDSIPGSIVLNRDRGRPLPSGQPLQLGRKDGASLAGSRLEPCPHDLERLARPIEGEIDPCRDHAVVQERERIVASGPLRGRGIDPDPVVETKQGQGSLALED